MYVWHSDLVQRYAAFAEGAASRHESDAVAFVSVFLF